ncbi:hypothetical protein ANCCAN_04669 [Ancylostoma caninum]|uniref:Uncharacterized protein n=1 Tax=Ancylostoma caninum TaxID=29170 RepID=A0A368GY42_ANCCA|nr:hypothetical protein ANCCAN_04669 [Ancylostoma caninum]
MKGASGKRYTRTDQWLQFSESTRTSVIIKKESMCTSGVSKQEYMQSKFLAGAQKMGQTTG